jgi:hypothetical protein
MICSVLCEMCMPCLRQLNCLISFKSREREVKGGGGESEHLPEFHCLYL